ncbi:MAG TPA: helix-turn-helix transcriptional regulator [Anaerovoracaceae bacterium]|nr:helix-turn-helix transcriptional regulator [Anaerovoracaceae bacterium]
MENLKKLRLKADLSQEKLANQLGLTQQSIHSYENGIYEPDIATLKQLAACFDTSVDYLIGNTEIRRKIEKSDKYELNAEEAEVIRKYRSLTKKNRKSLQLILDSLL